MLDQFDAGQWGSGAAQQLGLGTPKQKKPGTGKRSKAGVTTTPNRTQQSKPLESQDRYDRETGPLPPARRKSAFFPRCSSQIPRALPTPRGSFAKGTGNPSRP